jgi:indolepyruvate ferredoxin oxidoreductase, alpha subunit
MAPNRITQLIEAPDGQVAVLQGNIALAVGCARGGIHAADGYPGTPSTEVIDKGLRYAQDHMRVGWSVNEATAAAVGFGTTMVGDDALVTMKIPGLFQAGDVVSSVAGCTAPRGGLVFYVASDFVPSSTQHVIDARYFLRSCFIPILEPRDHQEMMDFGPLAAAMGRKYMTPVVVLASGLLCHSEGLVHLNERRVVPRLESGLDPTRFMNLPRIAKLSYDEVLATRMPALRAFAEESDLNRIEWNDRSLGVVVHGITEPLLREVWNDLPVKPSVLSLGMTFPLPLDKVNEFMDGVTGEVVVIGDGLRFVQEELLGQGHAVTGKMEFDSRTEWNPEAIAERLGAKPAKTVVITAAPVARPPNICAGCPYRAFGLTVGKLRKSKKHPIVASFGDIGCNTLLYFLDAIDACTCMGASEVERQGAVLADPSLAGRAISVIGDSTECHSGMDATRNAVFRNIPGVKVVLDNYITAMTGGQPAPSSEINLRGEENRFDLVAALKGEGVDVVEIDAYDMKAIRKGLVAALRRADEGAFTTLVIRGACMRETPGVNKQPRYTIDEDRCNQCGQCLICPGIEPGEDGTPHYTHLCAGCGGHEAVCYQRCARKGIKLSTEEKVAPPTPPVVALPDMDTPITVDDPPAAIRLAVRGVGGQGNLFLGKVLAELALRSGYTNVIKGETHGMAQLGGPVISTFGCGEARSPVPAPGSIDVLVALEQSEVLRPGFLELLKPEGAVLLNRLRIVPVDVEDEDYPTIESIRECLGDRRVIEFDALAEANGIGDTQGLTANVIAIGLLSTLDPFSRIPEDLWRRAIVSVTPGKPMQMANLAAFNRGRELE